MLRPDEPVPCRILADLLAEVSAPADPSTRDHGSGPSGDFTHADLRERYGMGDTWVRERGAAGTFGTGYRHGRGTVYTRAGVLAYDALMRGQDGATESEPYVRAAQRRSPRALSLVEKRRAS
jgi:hypothetical protein